MPHRHLALAALLAFTAGAPPGGVSGQDAANAELDWIAGHWAGPAFGGEAEEGWFAPAGGAMSGMFRLVRDGRAVVYELLLIERDADGEVYFRFRHVGPGWAPREEERLEYRLTELDGRRATFRSTAAAPTPGAPWWFTYERPAEDRLVITIHGAGGEPVVLELTRR